MKPKLDLESMLKKINDLVENNFCTEMEVKSLSEPSKYTQKEARDMAQMLAEVYSISHAVHCSECAKKYLNNKK